MKRWLLQKSGFILGAFWLTVSVSYGSDEWGEWVENEVSPWRSSGFIEAGYGFRLQGDPAKQQSVTLADALARAELDYLSDQWEVHSKWDLHVGGVTHTTTLNVRQFLFSGTLTDRLDIKAGRQVLSWGTGDYLFIT